MESVRKSMAEALIKIKLDPGAKLPVRAHELDAGIDIFARETKWIFPKCSRIFDSGVHIEIPPHYAGFLKSKSGLNVKHGITSEGVIDAGYTGSICVKLYNNSFLPYRVKAGDKISQLVIVPVLLFDTLEVTIMQDTERGENGFGSTGR